MTPEGSEIANGEKMERKGKNNFLKSEKRLFTDFFASILLPDKYLHSLSRWPDSAPLIGNPAPDSPHFDWNRVENYTVQTGATALLPCVIRNLGNESVRKKWPHANEKKIIIFLVFSDL